MRLGKSVLTGKEQEFFMLTRGNQAQRVLRSLRSITSLQSLGPSVEILQPTLSLPGKAGKGHTNQPLLGSLSVKGQSCIKSNFLLIRKG